MPGDIWLVCGLLLLTSCSPGSHAVAAPPAAGSSDRLPDSCRLAAGAAGPGGPEQGNKSCDFDYAGEIQIK